MEEQVDDKQSKQLNPSTPSQQPKKTNSKQDGKKQKRKKDPVQHEGATALIGLAQGIFGEDKEDNENDSENGKGKKKSGNNKTNSRKRKRKEDKTTRKNKRARNNNEEENNGDDNDDDYDYDNDNDNDESQSQKRRYKNGIDNRMGPSTIPVNIDALDTLFLTKQQITGPAVTLKIFDHAFLTNCPSLKNQKNQEEEQSQNQSNKKHFTRGSTHVKIAFFIQEEQEKQKQSMNNAQLSNNSHAIERGSEAELGLGTGSSMMTWSGNPVAERKLFQSGSGPMPMQGMANTMNAYMMTASPQTHQQSSPAVMNNKYRNQMSGNHSYYPMAYASSGFGYAPMQYKGQPTGTGSGGSSGGSSGGGNHVGGGSIPGHANVNQTMNTWMYGNIGSGQQTHHQTQMQQPTTTTTSPSPSSLNNQLKSQSSVHQQSPIQSPTSNQTHFPPNTISSHHFSQSQSQPPSQPPQQQYSQQYAQQYSQQTLGTSNQTPPPPSLSQQSSGAQQYGAYFGDGTPNNHVLQMLNARMSSGYHSQQQQQQEQPSSSSSSSNSNQNDTTNHNSNNNNNNSFGTVKQE